MQKIPFYIISGFLGSGKTTLLKRFIDKFADDYRIGVIQNEFAPANIDGKDLKETGKSFGLLEINNGSVFCVCLLGDFIQILSDFIDKYKPDLLIMEASGLSDTVSVAEMLSSPYLSGKIFLASIWCIIDALYFYKTAGFQQRLLHQIRMADIILINKTDLAGHYTQEIKKTVEKANPYAKVLETILCSIDPELGEGPCPKYYFEQVQPFPRPEINSMVIKSGKTLSIENLKVFLEKWSGNAYRIKGYVNLRDGSTVAVQCTYNLTEIRKVEFIKGPSELIALTNQFKLHEWSLSFRYYCLLP